MILEEIHKMKKGFIILVFMFFISLTVTGYGVTQAKATPYATKIPILTYHHILEQEEIDQYNWTGNSAVISTQTFQAHMDYLHENQYYTATLKELEEFMDGEIDLPKKTVVLTFDDGYLSNIRYAYPVMKQYGFKGVIFIIGKSHEKEPEEWNAQGLQYLSYRDSDKYKDVFEYGCHTHDMHRLGDKNLAYLRISTKEAVINDLSKNKALLQTDYISYPYGQYNQGVISNVKNLGYKLGFANYYGYVKKSTNKYKIPRINIYPTTTLEEFKSKVLGN